MRLAEIYAEDFDIGELALLPNQLKSFVNRARELQNSLDVLNLEKLLKLWSRLI